MGELEEQLRAYHYKHMHDITMHDVRRQLCFNSTFETADVIKHIEVALKEYRKSLYLFSTYGNFYYGPCYQQYSNMLNSIIYHLECMLEGSVVRWYHLPGKRSRIASYNAMLHEVKEHYLSKESEHNTYTPPAQRKIHRYDEGEIT